MKCFHVVSPVHNKQLRTPDTNYNMTATEITEEVSEAGCAFLEKLLGTKNYKRLLEIKRTYQFNSIQYSVEWLLNQADFSTQDRFYGSVQNAEDSCKTVTTGFLGSNIPEQHPEDRTQNVTNATLDLNNAPKLNIVGDDYSASLHTSSVPNSPARPTSDIEGRGNLRDLCQVSKDHGRVNPENSRMQENLVAVKEECFSDTEVVAQPEDYACIASWGCEEMRPEQSGWNAPSLVHVTSEFEVEKSRHSEQHISQQSKPSKKKTVTAQRKKSAANPFQQSIPPSDQHAKRFYCQFCTYATNSKSHMDGHSITHTNEKPHQCELCLKRFNLKGNLKKHYQTHNRKQFPCSQCGKQFSCKVSLLFHADNAHGAKMPTHPS